MTVDPIFDRAFRKLNGKPCWGLKNCVGTDITFEFGEPHLEIREPALAGPKTSRRVRTFLATRGVYVHGEWHLWICMCKWEILLNEKRVGSHRSRKSLDRVVNSLNGQKLLRFSINSRGTECRFEFDLGGVLLAHRFPSHSYAGDDQWNLDEPSGYVLTLRNDGMFSYEPANKPLDARAWKPVSSLRSRGRRRE